MLKAIIKMKPFLVKIIQKLFCRPCLIPLFTHLYKINLRCLGILNSEGMGASGEAWFLAMISKKLPIKIICDIGANTGGYTQELLKHFPKAQYHCFEPNPEIFKILSKKFKFESIHTYNLAVSCRNDQIKLYDFADSAPLKPTQPSATLASVYREVIEKLHHQPSLVYSVKAVTLDSWSKKRRLKRIDFLKIDTEGHEFPILQGAQKLIKNQQIGIIQFEFNEMNVYSRTFLKDIIQALPDYHFYRLLPHGLWPMTNYRPLTYEIFGYQNIAAICPQWNRKLKKVKTHV